MDRAAAGTMGDGCGGADEGADAELEGITLILPAQGDSGDANSNAMMLYPTGVMVGQGGISIDGTPSICRDTLMSHSLDLTEFCPQQLVQIAHQLILMSVPESRNFETELLAYISVVSNNYRDNPFHNFGHACTVLHCCFIFIGDIDSSLLAPMDRLGLLLSAIVHDVNHPGHANSFEKLIQSPLAIRYNNNSILERHHIAVCFALMRPPQADFTRHLGSAATVSLKKLMRSCIESTDMMQHASIVQSVVDKRGVGFDSHRPGDRSLLCSLLLHAADLFNPIRPFALARKWAQRISEEFNAQSKKETDLGFPLQPFMVTKHETKLAENEIFFTSTFVVPLWDNLSSIFPGFVQYRNSCNHNMLLWEEAKAASLLAGEGDAPAVAVAVK
jgi:hypothetical protein